MNGNSTNTADTRRQNTDNIPNSDEKLANLEGVDYASGKAAGERQTGGEQPATESRDRPEAEGTGSPTGESDRAEAAGKEAPSNGETLRQKGDDSAIEEPGELEQAREEIKLLKESWSRERAEFMNYKKRVAQEQARIRLLSVADFVSGLLPVLDNLKTVLKVQTDNPEVKNFVDGVELIQTEFLSVLQKNNIHLVETQDREFDPQIMEALMTENKPGLEKETVLEVFQEGYYLQIDEEQRQILRPARVKVGKPENGPGNG